MKKVSTFFAVSIILFSCSKDMNEQQSSSTSSAEDQQQQPVTTQQINQFIQDQYAQKGSFDWKDASDEMIWGALQNSDKIISVGYKPVTEKSIENRLHTININDAGWKAAKQQVLQLIFNEEQKTNRTLKIDNMEVWKESKLPVVDIKIENFETLKLLRQSKLVRYAEPMGYDPVKEFDKGESTLAGGSGCGGYDGNNSLINGTDYTVVSPNAKVSWNYSYHGIQNAWTKSTGAGVKVMVIDSGVSPDQDNLGSQFNQGLSTGRTIEKIFTLPGETSANDDCGHGTTMSGAVAAPRCTDGNSCGVAYNCNFVICRAAHDVYIDESIETKGISDAYTWAADNSTVKIISMSMGRLTSSGQIKDAIQYAYGKGKLMFCAGGTSFSWSSWLVGVIFPATLNEVQAITGIKDKTTLAACDDCHKGKQIDYVIVMEKQAGGLHSLSTATSGDVPTTVGGSSVATATAAGIAALVWSKFPTYTREDVLNKLTTTASSYPTKNKSYGWGKLNADAATN
ncbi:MAG: S8/S53 family peptidase [Panacibacter sp.]